ncbi:hypothetical protein X769_20990 [Mesorhizobium sp. LSJC268A00]|uniref:hypothetical protein n=1 Tax=unclassified Mesorhizobium TaxID=325217 RepID=UPI0003CE82B9|nr:MULTISPECIES: hypothetical protein [unclassified Mesorhizobium]ESW80386.1 hypothetical protein X770_31070 [Mesorhizobium sp. LSJC269B00]ESX01708.1 hypothetical protein X769_20990 [Mesorhizobium sp. LSJC268A00]ESX10439.1 hypothetical protein X768_14190 [Mesorhizobium sp. LSJC265A00]ESZ02950.1 hypothetical protein X736_27710 [Mesorhizobium sp. L2C089B000]ESZ12128.1 hypothetical protein X735_24055 [Mesorhizobium sp. L2C085B000]
MEIGRVERKLSAILAADLAGYSQLMGADEEGALERLNSHQRDHLDPCIATHRGKIVGDIIEQDGHVLGAGVNIAARLERIAEPGRICVSERVQEHAAGKIGLRFEDS